MALTIYSPAKKLSTVESVVIHGLKLLSQWLRSNTSLNETKTDLIIFRSSQKN